MASVTAIRNGLRDRLKVINGLTIHTRWPNQPQFPCAVISRGRSEPEQTFGRGDLTLWRFDVTFMGTLAPGYEAAQDAMDPYLATSSTGGLYSAIHADRTLGGVVSYTTVRALGEDDQLELSEQFGVQAWVAELEVWAS